jgi:formylaminopyrimidine deformylase
VESLPHPIDVELSQLEQEVVGAVAAGEARLFGLLETLIRFRTPNPPGGNESAAQRWMADQLDRLGLEVDVWDALPGRPNVVGTLRGVSPTGPTVVLNGHVDVCEDRLVDRWSSDPYEPVTAGRDMIGRGASDMKSALASFLFALEVLRRHDVRLGGTVVFQSVIGEEAGEPGTRSAIDRGHVGDLAIVGESSRARALVACVGVLNARVSVSSPITLHLSARKSILNAGGNQSGANCVEKMALRILPALSDLERQWAVFKVHPLLPHGSCNINVFRVEGGGNPFMLPDTCTAHVTVTYLPTETRESVVAEIEKQIATAAALDDWLRANPPTVEWLPEDYPIEFAPAAFDASSQEIRQLQGAIRAVTGEEPTLGGRSGITDAGWFYAAGIPAVVFGPGDMAYAHAIDERVHLDDVVGHCQAIALFLLRYCGVETDG